MERFLYVKLLLYAFPRLERLEDSLRCSAENKALLSFRAQCDTFTLAAKIADMFLMADALCRLRGALSFAVNECTEEEKFLLEYKYFRRKKELSEFAGKRLLCSRRTYFRHQSAVLSKMAALLARQGYTQREVVREFGGYPPFRKVYRALKEGAERRVVFARTEGAILFAQNSSAGEGFLPLSTKKAIAAGTSTAAQIAAICSAEGDALSAGGFSGSPETGSR